MSSGNTTERPPKQERRKSIHRRLSGAFQLVLLLAAVAAAWNGLWASATFTTLIVVLTMAPFLLGKRLRVFIPPEFELLAIAFVFATLFLGEVRSYYTRFWWWDIALHTSSGFLLGILGFLLVHVLNEKEELDVHMKPSFVAIFAFVFSIAVGAVWEIFEFTMDSVFGLQMQKPMFGDPSGLTDTMWDLIVDTVGALVIALLGYSYLRAAGNRSFLERWIDAFIEANPRFFGRKQP
ncbi:MAG: hypothetical protein HQ519_13890 [Planctomycetes bacterium]|nr:hypothetical protein [Planctomycetota bacterium]